MFLLCFSTFLLVEWCAIAVNFLTPTYLQRAVKILLTNSGRYRLVRSLARQTVWLGDAGWCLQSAWGLVWKPYCLRQLKVPFGHQDYVSVPLSYSRKGSPIYMAPSSFGLHGWNNQRGRICLYCHLSLAQFIDCGKKTYTSFVLYGKYDSWPSVQYTRLCQEFPAFGWRNERCMMRDRNVSGTKVCVAPSIVFHRSENSPLTGEYSVSRCRS